MFAKREPRRLSRLDALKRYAEKAAVRSLGKDQIRKAVELAFFAHSQVTAMRWQRGNRRRMVSLPMHMFFAGVAKGGRSIGVEDRQRFIDTVRSEVVFSAHVKRVVHLAPTPDAIIVGISNEPDGGWLESWRRQVFVSGYCSDTTGLVRLDATETLAETASQLAGRFSVLVVDKLRGRFALATQPARIDSIFTAENDRFAFFGNQASVLSVLRDGVVRYAPEQLLTFLTSGFFGDDQTPYSGVRCVSAYTTVEVKDGRLVSGKRCLSTLRRNQEARPLASSPHADLPGSRTTSWQMPERMPTDFVKAFSSFDSAPCYLGLTGGIDSRLVLAGASAARIDLECYTHAYDAANRAEVWVAKRIAQLAGMRHRTLEVERFGLEGVAPAARLREAALWTLAATDGMLSCQYRAEPIFSFTPARHLSGAGGEILRGGYSEKLARPTKDQVIRHLQHQWNHSPQLFQRDLVQQETERARGYVEGFSESVSPADMLDYLYVDVRCGRWAAATTAGSSTLIRPLLDNLMVRNALAIPVIPRRHHVVHRQLIERLLPVARDFPLANKFWHGTSEDARESLLRTWPQAFSELKEPAARASSNLGPEEVAAIEHYVFGADRVSLLADVLRVDEVKHYLASARDDRYRDRILRSLYSAALLLTEPWRDLRHAEREVHPLFSLPSMSA